MKHSALMIFTLGVLSSQTMAQEFVVSGTSFGGAEPLYAYDDLDPWKHGWIQVIPYYGGYHSYRPYNYKQLLSQSAQAAVWGMPHSMPYSQQFYHRYENFAGADVHARSMQPLPYQSHRSAMVPPGDARSAQLPVIAPASGVRQNEPQTHRSAPGARRAQDFSHQARQTQHIESLAADQSLLNSRLQHVQQQPQQIDGPVMYERLPGPAINAP